MTRTPPKIEYNPAYSDYFGAAHRYAVVWGGRGSGKSYAVAQKHVMRCLKTPGERFLVVRNVLKSCRASTFQLLRDVIASAHIEALVNRTEMAIRFPNGSEILHAGLDDPSKLRSITGVTSIWTEEASEVRQPDFDDLDVLPRGEVPTYIQHTLTFNPISHRLWLRARLVDADRPDVIKLHTTWRDNLFVGDSYGRLLASIPDAQKRAIYEAGEWGEDVRGLIYTDWGTAPAPLRHPDAYGLDFGFNHPNALVAIWDEDPALHADELVYETHMTTADLVDRMAEAGVRKDVPMFCDAARPDQIEEIRRAGYDAIPADKDVLAGIQTVKGYDLRVTPDSQNLINELSAYKWAETRDGTPLDKPVKWDDDACDALRYAAHTLLAERTNTWGIW